jgi:hypothetical protein
MAAADEAPRCQAAAAAGAAVGAPGSVPEPQSLGLATSTPFYLSRHRNTHHAQATRERLP